jgi:hypothetical protein
MTKKIEIFNGYWTVDDVINNPDKIFVFGDNDKRTGKGGQAIIRDLINAIGIRTKKKPDTTRNCYYTDLELEENKKKIFDDISNIKTYLLFGYKIVFSNGGYGTERAKLKEKAPKTYEYLCQMLKDNFNFNNESGKKFIKIPSYEEMKNAKEIPMNYSHGILSFGQEVPGMFRKELLDKGITNTFDAVKQGFRIATTRNERYKAGDIIRITSKNHKESLICRITTDSYPVSSIPPETWSILEGWDISYFKLNPSILDKYQFQFDYICEIGNGNLIKFKDNIL